MIISSISAISERIDVYCQYLSPIVTFVTASSGALVILFSQKLFELWNVKNLIIFLLLHYFIGSNTMCLYLIDRLHKFVGVHHRFLYRNIEIGGVN